MITRLLILLLLIATPCHAFSPGFLGVITGGGIICVTANSINGISVIAGNNTSDDTGTCAEFTATAASITLLADCATVESTAAVYLIVDGVERDSLVCGTTETITDSELSYSVSAGVHSIRVYCDAGEDASCRADTFSIPIP